MSESVGKASVESAGYENLDASTGSTYNPFPCKSSAYEGDFVTLIQQAQEAIQTGINPELIKQGTRGSYFMMDKDKVRIIQ